LGSVIFIQDTAYKKSFGGDVGIAPLILNFSRR